MRVPMRVPMRLRVPRFDGDALANRAVDDNVDAAGAPWRSDQGRRARSSLARAESVASRVSTQRCRVRTRGATREGRRAYRVAEVAVDALAKHVRRGKCRDVAPALRAARRATRDVDEKSDAMSSSDSESEDSESEDSSSSSARVVRAAHAVSVVAAAVEVYNGARVEAHGPIFEPFVTTRFPRWRASRSTSVSSEDVGELATATHRLSRRRRRAR